MKKISLNTQSYYFYYYFVVKMDSGLEEAKQMEVAGRYPEAHKCLTDLIGGADEDDDSLLAPAYNLRGKVNRMLTQYADALNDFNQALFYADNGVDQGESYIGVADIQRLKKNYPAAHESIQTALSVIRPQMTLTTAKALDFDGLIFLAEKNYEAASLRYHQAAAMCETLMHIHPDDKDVKNRYFQALQHIGVVYMMQEQKDLRKAEDVFTDAYRIAIELDDKQGRINCLASLGGISMERGNHQNAVIDYSEAYQILSETKYGRAIVPVALGLTEAHIALGEAEKARPYWERFQQGIKDGELMPADLEMMQPQIAKVTELCNGCGLGQ